MLRNLFVSRWLHICALTFLLMVLVYVKVNPDNYAVVHKLENLAFDNYNRAHPRPQLKDNPEFQKEMVVMVDLDEKSLEKIGQWPWPRNLVGDLVLKLKEKGAKVIAFDIVFSEPDRTSPNNYLKYLDEQYKNEALESALSGIPSNDTIFAKKIKEAGNVITAFTIARDKTRTDAFPERTFRGLIKPKDIQKNVFTKESLTINLPEIADASAGTGSFMMAPDVDGIVRKIPVIVAHKKENEDPKRFYPTLALEAMYHYMGVNNTAFFVDYYKRKGQKQRIWDPLYRVVLNDYGDGKDYIVPIDEKGKLRIYWSKQRTDDYIPAWQVLEDAVPEERLKDTIVFIGTSAEGLRDIRSTPIDIFTPGVETHVNLAEQILSETYLVRPKVFELVEAAIIFIIGLGIIFLSPFVGATFLFVLIAGLICSAFAFSYHAFLNIGLLIDPVFPSISLGIIFMLSAMFSYIRSESERKQIREAFGLYISPEYMEELTSNPSKLSLGGQTKNLTVMFTDIRSFTTISESLTPEELIQLMNDFLTPMSDLVMVNRGTIDKYMGDAMMAFWNAPLDDPQHARNACRAALRMNEALVPINENLAQRAKDTGTEPLALKAGIGINTGSASVGNMGSKQRFAYSALGDTVNLASRLEGQTKDYGVETLVGEGTKIKADDFALLELDLIRVKGKQEPERIFALIGDEELAKTPEFIEWQDTHNAMLANYRKRDFDTAQQLIQKCLKLNNGQINAYYEMFDDRIEGLKAAGLPEDWDGVYVATSK